MRLCSNVGFLLAKASQRWNELLQRRFRELGWSEVRPSYGSLLIPLWEEDELRMGELAGRARLSKQTLTTMARLLERDGLVELRPDAEDRRATRVCLTRRGKRLRSLAEGVLAELQIFLVGQLSQRRASELQRSLAELADLDRSDERSK